MKRGTLRCRQVSEEPVDPRTLAAARALTPTPGLGRLAAMLNAGGPVSEPPVIAAETNGHETVVARASKSKAKKRGRRT